MLRGDHFPERRFEGSQLECHCEVCPLAIQLDRLTEALLGGSILALLVIKWGFAMSKDEEISGPGVQDFELESQVKELSNSVTLSPAHGSLGGKVS